MTKPIWIRGGNELFFEQSGGKLMAVPVTATPVFSSGDPKMIYADMDVVTNLGQKYAPMPDGLGGGLERVALLGHESGRITLKLL